MKAKLLVLASVAALFGTLFAPGCGSKTPKTPAAEPVVKKIDHITITTNQAQELFAIFNTTLGLPVAWPFSAYPGFSTGGVQAGNVNLETVSFEGTPTGDGSMAGIYGIVFEPYPLDQIMGLLADRGADPSDPEVQTREINGQQVPFWTNVTLNALCFPEYIVYLTEYSDIARQELEGHKVSGPLGGVGVLAVEEIRIGATDADALKQKWSDVFAPDSMSVESLMAIGDGPAVRIVPADRDALEGLVFSVSSLDAARTFLASRGLLGSDSSGSVLFIDPAKIQGLEISLIQG